ncbi:hypothetical protein [Caballeronia sp. INDeC2]|uniref:hypothetical protein n=1 Tax=Caballeronia sp. INDeC2 TaxID=2921747 RepID=UPI002029027C|nr:hypothetical protein [Caballeronia sp. INDeC2]
MQYGYSLKIAQDCGLFGGTGRPYQESGIQQCERAAAGIKKFAEVIRDAALQEQPRQDE